MKTRKLLFLTIILMVFSFTNSFAQQGSPGTCGTITPYYNNNNNGWNNITDAATVFNKSLEVIAGKNIVVGINPSNAPRRLTITINGGSPVVINPAGDYTVINPVPTVGSTASVVVLYTDACGTYTYTWNLTGVLCSSPVLYFNNNMGSGWVDPATIVSNNINVPGLFSTGAGIKFTAGIRLNGGVSVTWSDGLGFTSTATGDVDYYPNFIVGGTSTRTLTAAYKNSCNNVVNYTYTLTAAATCIPSASTFYYNTGDGNWHDPTTPVSNNIDVPTLLPVGSGTVFEPGIHLGAGCSVVWSDSNNPNLSTNNQFQYHPNLTSNETKVLTATITNNCGTVLPSYTYTLHATSTCIPLTYTPYYNNGNSVNNGWVDAADASPINLNAKVGNSVILGINPGGLTALWTDGIALNQTNGEFSYVPAFTAAGQTRDVTATFTDNCGNAKSYTFHITSECNTYTPYYNNGSNGANGWVNATDASPINLNAEIGNDVILGINPGSLSALWTDGMALNQTNGELTYTPAFTAPGQTRDVTATFTDNCGSKSYTFHITAVIPNTTWNGTAWSFATPPSSSIEAIIAGTYSTATNGAFIAKKLTVNSGITLTINSGTNVTVQNEVINNGNTIIENNANLIQVNNTTNIGNVVVNRNSNDLFRLDFAMWSSPVSGTQTLAGFSPLTSQSPSRFYTYDADAIAYSNTLNPSTTPFAIGKGYLIRMPNTDPTSGYDSGTASLIFPGVFMGVPNNGTISVTTVANKYNGLGNPYPSVIDAESFKISNPDINTLYFWRKTNNLNQGTSSTSSYATYNITTATGTGVAPDGVATGHPTITPDKYIQVGQGFLFTTAQTSVVFNNGMRIANNNNKILKTKIVEKDRIWLNLSNPSWPINQMALCYTDGATQGIDEADSKYFNDSQTALNSLINNEEYAIQGRSLPFDGTDVVPLAFKTTVNGDFTIAIDHVDGLFSGSQDIILKDNTTGTETNLKTSAYNFTATAGVDNARFSIKYQKTLKVDALAFNDNSVKVYKNGETLYVNSGSSAIKNIKVFDIQGRLVAEQKNVNANVTAIKNLKVANQVLVVQVTSEDNYVVNKKVVN